MTLPHRFLTGLEKRLARRIPDELIEMLAVIWNPTWLTDYNVALSEASNKGMRVLAAFTGYPWCGGCMSLQAEVFMASDFGYWVNDKQLVLLDINCAEIGWTQAQMDVIKRYWTPDENGKYNVSVPTVIALNADGTERGRLGDGYPSTSGSGFANWTHDFEIAAKLNTCEGSCPAPGPKPPI